jgi:hypothetical protein
VPWYPSAKACPAAIKPTVQCFFPTLYQVLLFDFSSFGEKLFFCLRGYRRAIARSAVQKQPERRALRPQARFGAQPPQAALGAEIGCSSVTPPPNRRRMGGGDNLALLLGGAANPAPPPTSYRRAKLALNVRIGCSCRAHNHHKFSHRILQPHTKRRASHAD